MTAGKTPPPATLTIMPSNVLATTGLVRTPTVMEKMRPRPLLQEQRQGEKCARRVCEQCVRRMYVWGGCVRGTHAGNLYGKCVSHMCEEQL